MARPKNPVPSYLPHKKSGQARVRLKNGSRYRDVYLGEYGSPESYEKYRQVVAEHGGRVPRTLAAMRALPGVGRYTAGAVLSIAYGLPTPVLDGNVERVRCRLPPIDGNPRAGPTRKRLGALAAILIPVKKRGHRQH